MKYKREWRPFTLSNLLSQISEYVMENGKYPKTIYLPPEEFVFLNLIINTPKEMVTVRVDRILGIPIKADLSKQEKSFQGY